MFGILSSGTCIRRAAAIPNPDGMHPRNQSIPSFHVVGFNLSPSKHIWRFLFPFCKHATIHSSTIHQTIVRP